jgi:FtsH-binding integral membrane protein
MNRDEERLQEKIEANTGFDDGNPDTQAYRQVFQALEKTPRYALPDTFADKMLRKIEQKEQRSLRITYAWLVAGIVLLTGGGVAAVVMTGFQFEAGFLRGMADYKGLLAFGVAFVLFLHWLDKRLIHRHNPSR